MSWCAAAGPPSEEQLRNFLKILNRFLQTSPVRRQAAESADNTGQGDLLRLGPVLCQCLPEVPLRRILVNYEALRGQISKQHCSHGT